MIREPRIFVAATRKSWTEQLCDASLTGGEGEGRMKSGRVGESRQRCVSSFKNSKQESWRQYLTDGIRFIRQAVLRVR